MGALSSQQKYNMQNITGESNTAKSGVEANAAGGCVPLRPSRLQ